MQRPAGFSDSDSSDDYFYQEPPPKKGQHVDGLDENEDTENVWFDKDKNKSVDQSNKLNSTYNAERAVYLSTGSDEASAKNSTSQPISRQASPLPFSHVRMAIIQGNLPIVESLIQKGIDVNQTIKSGWTLLMVAASSGQDHVLKYLLEKGANPNLNKAFFTALMAAAAAEKAEDKIVSCVEQLIEYDADIDAAETHGMTALMFAAKAGKSKVLEVLLRSGADIHKFDRKELTALFWAVSADQKEAVKVLLKGSANPKQIAMGQNVIESAIASGNNEMACLLEKHCRGALENKDWKELSEIERNNIVYDAKEEQYHSYREVETVLTTIGAESVIPILREHKISLMDFMHLTEKDLISMGITQFGTRFDIITAIKSINVEEWKKSSLPDILNKKCVTLEDSIAMVRNMDAHIRYMSATFGFVRSAIETYPQLFSIERKSSDALHLTNTCLSYLRNVNGLKLEIEELRTFLNKECNNQEYTRADVITRRNDDVSWKSFSLVSLGVVTTLTTLAYIFKPKLFANMFVESVPQVVLVVDLAK